MSYGDEGDEPLTFNVDQIIAVTDKAALCRIDGEKVWLPFSEMDPSSEILIDRDSLLEATGDVIIPRWLAEEKGLV